MSQSGSSRRKNAKFSVPHFQWDWSPPPYQNFRLPPGRSCSSSGGVKPQLKRYQPALPRANPLPSANPTLCLLSSVASWWRDEMLCRQCIAGSSKTMFHWTKCNFSTADRDLSTNISKPICFSVISLLCDCEVTEVLCIIHSKFTYI